jgi:hypothetical protein
MIGEYLVRFWGARAAGPHGMNHKNPDPGGARNPFPARVSKIATVVPMASIIRLRNRKPLRNPWATPSIVAKPPRTLLVSC